MTKPKKPFLHRIYENIDVNIKVGILVFGIFVILILASALAILYANGSRPNGLGFVETGSLRVLTEPSDVQVYLDETQQNLNNRQINGLIPGQYTLRISKDGFIDWTKEIEIQEGLVEEQFVKLFPTELNLNQFSQTNIDKVVFDETGTYAYYSVIDSEIGSDIGIWRVEIANPNPLNIFNNNENTIKLTDLTEEIESISQGEAYELIPSPDNRNLIIKTDKHYIIDANRYSEPDPENTVESRVNYNFSELNWFRNSNSIITVSNGLIAETQLNNGETNLISFNSDINPIYTISGDIVYFFDQDEKALKSYTNGISSKINLSNRKIEGEIISIHTGRQSEDNLYYMNSDNEIYYLNLERSYSANITKLIEKSDNIGLQENIEIQEISSDGTAALIKMQVEDTTQFGVFIVEEIAGNNTFRNEFNLFESEDSVTKAQFSPSGINVAISTNNNNLVVSDLEFENIIPLISSTETDNSILINNSYRLNRDDSQIFVLITENSGETDSSEARNLYVINLEQTN